MNPWPRILSILTNADRIANREKMVAALSLQTKTMTKDQLLKACEDKGVPAGPINAMDEVFADPQVIHRQMQVELDGIPSVRSPFTFSDAELSLQKPSPKLGENNS